MQRLTPLWAPIADLPLAPTPCPRCIPVYTSALYVQSRTAQSIGGTRWIQPISPGREHIAGHWSTLHRRPYLPFS